MDPDFSPAPNVGCGVMGQSPGIDQCSQRQPEHGPSHCIELLPGESFRKTLQQICDIAREIVDGGYSAQVTIRPIRPLHSHGSVSSSARPPQLHAAVGPTTPSASALAVDDPWEKRDPARAPAAPLAPSMPTGAPHAVQARGELAAPVGLRSCLGDDDHPSATSIASTLAQGHITPWKWSEVETAGGRQAPFSVGERPALGSVVPFELAPRGRGQQAMPAHVAFDVRAAAQACTAAPAQLRADVRAAAQACQGRIKEPPLAAAYAAWSVSPLDPNDVQYDI